MMTARGMAVPVRFWFSVWPFAYDRQYEKVMLMAYDAMDVEHKSN